MIDLTPLDVRKKRGDFRRLLRGYDPQDVDAFLDLVAERMEGLVKENLTLAERSKRLAEQLRALEERERAVKDALVTAQQLRADVQEQSRREADLLLREAEAEIQRRLGEVDRVLRERRGALEEMERQRLRFLKSFRALLERELEAVGVEEARPPLEEISLELELRGGSGAEPGTPPAPGGPEEPLWLSSLLRDQGEKDRGEEPRE